MDGDIDTIAGYFLSEVREKSQAGRARPVRIPPGGAVGGIKLEVTPSYNPAPSVEKSSPDVDRPSPVVERSAPVAPPTPLLTMTNSQATENVGVHVMVAPHVPSEALTSVCAQVARGIVGGGGRAGVLIVGVGLFLFDAGLPADGASAASTDNLRELSENVAELTPEVEAWVICVRDVGASKGILSGAAGWVVPVGAGSDGLVDAYRTIKLLGQGERLPLVLAGAGGQEKLRGVMRKFLMWDAVSVLPLADEGDSDLHPLLSFEGDCDEVVLPLLSMRAALWSGEPAPTVTEDAEAELRVVPMIDLQVPEPAVREPEILDLEGGDVLQAVLKANRGLLACDVRVPGDAGRLAVDSDGRLLVLAVISDAADFAGLGRAMAWARENIELIARAVRPLRVNVDAEPSARVYLDRDAANVTDLFVGSAVQVQAFRRVRWGEKKGLLLEAA